MRINVSDLNWPAMVTAYRRTYKDATCTNTHGVIIVAIIRHKNNKLLRNNKTIYNHTLGGIVLYRSKIIHPNNRKLIDKECTLAQIVADEYNNSLE